MNQACNETMESVIIRLLSRKDASREENREEKAEHKRRKLDMAERKLALKEDALRSKYRNSAFHEFPRQEFEDTSGETHETLNCDTWT